MSKRVLVVDDDDGVREIIQLSLETVAGWDVLMASTGREGFVIAAAEKPDLILLDVMMPEEDGIEIYKQLQAEPSTQAIPTILLTAKAQISERQEFMELGIVGIITKPFQARALVEDIIALLKW
ncbi:MAG: response regulator [Cyanobacteria bacterium P01_F01_bin.53]